MKKKNKKLSIDKLKVESFITSLNDFNRQTIQGGDGRNYQVAGEAKRKEVVKKTENYNCPYTDYKLLCDLSALGPVGTCGTDECGTCDNTCNG